MSFLFPRHFQTWIYVLLGFCWEKNPRKQWILGIELWKYPAMFATFVLAKTQNYQEMGQTWVPNWQFWGVDSVDMF